MCVDYMSLIELTVLEFVNCTSAVLVYVIISCKYWRYSECFYDSEDSSFDSDDDELVVNDVAVVGTIANTCCELTDCIERCWGW